MPCFHPIPAWRSYSPEDINPSTGRAVLRFTRPPEWSDRKAAALFVSLPCGSCIGCRLERSRQWAIRCMHEASLYDSNCFLTLTYNSENLPLLPDGRPTLRPLDVTKFLKRLRKRYSPTLIRFFQCGEYGHDFSRPHHHLCIFGLDFPDMEAFSKSSSGELLYRSPSLESLWTLGFSTVGALTFDTVAYTARYILKKINGPTSDEHYDGRFPEYITMSRRPGIGRNFYDKYKSDIYNHDLCVVRDGLVLRPPRYYDKCFDLDTTDITKLYTSQIKYIRPLSILKTKRLRTLKSKDPVTPERLATLERSLMLKSKKLLRSLENQ